MKKNLRNLIYSAPFILASFLPMQKANAQMMKSNAFDRWDIPKKIQPEKLNEISLGFQPIDLGVSIGYTRKINPKYGLYLSFSKGKYRSGTPLNKEIFKKSYVDHFKISLGGNIYLKNYKNNSSSFISFGPSYSICNKEHYTDRSINEKAFKPWSFEGGAGVTLAEKATIGFLFDPLKGESKVYLGINF